MKKSVICSFVVLLLFLISILPVYASDTEANGLGELFRNTSLYAVYIASAIVTLLIIYSLHNPKSKYKNVLFILMVVPIILATFYVSGTTLYLNFISETKGPVHWHADFEVWNCNEELDLLDPTGLSNRIGTPVLHEHNDNRIHVEGVVVDTNTDVSLKNFFKVIGSELEKGFLNYPTNNGILEIKDGDFCDNKKGKLQVFVYRVINPEERDNWIYEQFKVVDYSNYVLSPHVLVPEGDCIIVEFGEEKNQTDKICDTYEVYINKGELSGS